MIAHTDGGVTRWAARSSPRRPTGPGFDRNDRLDGLIESTRDWLLAQRRDDGHWVGELEGDTILESEYVLMMAFLGRHDDGVCRKLARYLLDQERADGGWAIYPGGPFDLGASVKAYFALKLTGTSPDDPRMARVRALILDGGGADLCNSFTRFYLAILGQIGHEDTPSVPPELVFLPRRVPISLGAMSSWTRTIVVPLSIISALKPVRPVPEGLGIAELFRRDLPKPRRRTSRLVSWCNVFLAADRAFKAVERIVPKAWRRPGIGAAHRWMVTHFDRTDGLGAIFPPMVYTIIALDALGYPGDDPAVVAAHKHLDDLLIEEDGAVRVQPCVSPTWDTAIAAIALADADLPADHPALIEAVRWLLAREVRTLGDWAPRGTTIEPTGWHFQYNNLYYPDLDDTAMVLLALQRTALASSPEVRAATGRGVAWLLAMQNRDGGWAAYDRDVTNPVLTKVPFADHNAILDPSCADITARVVELLGRLGETSDHPAVARALDYLRRTQEPDGSWYGRWGVNYIYGTWQVLQGLAAIGHPMETPEVRRAVSWLESVQQADGGWGESPASYDDPGLKGRGEPTASQTAWAVLGLVSAGRADSRAVQDGLRHLGEAQRPDGTWDEPEFTGTGFPRVFYLKYHLYRVYFPLMALARSRAALAGGIADRAVTPAGSLDV